LFYWPRILIICSIVLLVTYLLFSERIEKFSWNWTAVIAIVAIASLIITYIQTNKHFDITLKETQKQFELANRPFIELVNPRFLCGKNSVDKNIYLNKGKYPEVAFKVYIALINHGHLPAYVKNIECIIENLDDPLEYCLAGPYPGDKENQWGNFDVFPYKEGREYGNTKTPFLNTNDIARIMGVKQNFKEVLLDKENEFWKNDETKICEDIEKELGEFYIYFQIRYYKMGVNYQKAQPYFYSVKFKRLSNGENVFIKSITGNDEKEGKWFKIDEVGHIERI